MSKRRIKPGYLLPSAAFTLKRRQIVAYEPCEEPPRVGDVLYAEVERLGHHGEVINKHGRHHRLVRGSRLIGVIGSRYAPDEFEVMVPDEVGRHLDLASRGGVLGELVTRNSAATTPTRVRVMGHVVDAAGTRLNTLDYPFLPDAERRPEPGSRLVLVCGTAMNAGKTTVASSCCWALAAMGHEVHAAKLTGTANVNDILRMNDAGASAYCDFSYLGYPSTYMLGSDDLRRILLSIEAKYATNPRGFWVVELADGILQRETAMMLADETVRGRIHRLLFAARDTFGALGGIEILRTRFGLAPDAISGIIASSPLLVRELAEHSAIPIINSVDIDLDEFCQVLM
jgi:hypothetical protein